jgi:uncharacterized protein YjbJ (UPF0337 family)
MVLVRRIDIWIDSRRFVRRCVMKLSTKYLSKGIFHVVRGTVKETAGRISSNTTLGVKGKFERFTGKVQLRIGKAQGVFGL